MTQTGTSSGTVGGGGTFAAGTLITPTATADANSTFTGWSPSNFGSRFTLRRLAQIT
ncbi:InlB B-repeat-containing protein [Thiocystis minor]|uniref:InlB B-repeat-containing protein n=1 Tax=Thiocystis minor TaxID=61597 RepID=UPI001912C983